MAEVRCRFGLLFIREKIALLKMSLIKLVSAPVFASILGHSKYLSDFQLRNTIVSIPIALVSHMKVEKVDGGA